MYVFQVLIHGRLDFNCSSAICCVIIFYRFELKEGDLDVYQVTERALGASNGLFVFQKKTPEER